MNLLMGVYVKKYIIAVTVVEMIVVVVVVVPIVGHAMLVRNV